VADSSSNRPEPDQRHELGPFDIIGDVHGCYDELRQLLEKLGYTVDPTDPPPAAPPGRRLVFVGDLVDRGPWPVRTLRLIMSLVRADIALCVPGNHDDKLRRWLGGQDVKLRHGLAETVSAVAAEPAAFRRELAKFLTDQPFHLWLDRGELVVAHAGILSHMIGRHG
jgi:protein phosphatase